MFPERLYQGRCGEMIGSILRLKELADKRESIAFMRGPNVISVLPASSYLNRTAACLLELIESHCLFRYIKPEKSKRKIRFARRADRPGKKTATLTLLQHAEDYTGDSFLQIALYNILCGLDPALARELVCSDECRIDLQKAREWVRNHTRQSEGKSEV